MTPPTALSPRLPTAAAAGGCQNPGEPPPPGTPGRAAPAPGPQAATPQGCGVAAPQTPRYLEERGTPPAIALGGGIAGGPNARAGLDNARPVVRAERADGANAAKREREARLAAYNGVIQARLPDSPRTETHQERVAEYRRLTRDLGLARKAAQRRLGISLATVQNYERAITGLTGTQRRQQLQARHAELLAQGLNHIEIGRRLGIHRRTSMAWARLREAT